MTKLLLAAALSATIAARAQQPTESGSVRTAYTYHILLRSEAEASGLRDEIARVKPADQLAKFKAVAKRSSIDPSSRKLGGNLDWVYEGEMVKSFEEAVFASEHDRVTGPFKSEFGWHLTYVTGFRTLAVSGICQPALSSSYHRASGQSKAGLELAMRPFDPITAPEDVRVLLGADWSAPLKDPNGNLVFIRIHPEGDPAVREVTQHIELIDGLLEVTARPKGCSHSARIGWAIRCTDKSAAAISRSTFEGRGALGRVLSKSRLDPSSASFQPIADGTFVRQLHELACSQPTRRGQTTRSTPPAPEGTASPV